MADGNPGVTPDSACLACHNGTIAPDKFTTWKDSGHAFIMKQNINDPAGHWSATSCGPCHTVGYNQFATAIQNGGWDQVSKVEGFKFTQGPLAWTQTLANYPKTAKLSNIQCENCHGPQAGGGAHTLVWLARGSTSPAANALTAMENRGVTAASRSGRRAGTATI